MPNATDPEGKTESDKDEAATGDGGTDAAKDTSGEGTGTSTDQKPEGKTFSQEDVNRILKRETGKLEADAEAWREHKKQSATDEEKRAQEQREKDEAIAERERKANEKLLRASILEAARSANIDPEFEDLVIDALMRSESVEVGDDGEVTGVTQAIKAMIAKKPKLVAGKRPPGQSGSEFGGRETKTLDEQIAAAEAKGDWKLSRRLKLQKLNTTA
jgi:hypothetical protein